MQSTSPTTAAIVIDANVAIWAVLPASSTIDALGLFGSWRRAGLRLVAPTLWLPECVSAIRRMAYIGATTDEQARIALEDLLDLEVETVPPNRAQCRSALEWATRLGQSRAYDGFYLAVAEEMGLQFWTGDRRLANAAQRAGVPWVHAVA